MTDEIMDRYTELSLLNIIPDMQEYAKDWMRLAVWADIQERPSTAETCRKRARHYCEIGGGEYIRLVEGCYAELLKVEAEQTAFFRIQGEPYKLVERAQIGEYQNVYRDGDSRHIAPIPLMKVAATCPKTKRQNS